MPQRYSSQKVLGRIKRQVHMVENYPKDQVKTRGFNLDSNVDSLKNKTKKKPRKFVRRAYL